MKKVSEQQHKQPQQEEVGMQETTQYSAGQAALPKGGTIVRPAKRSNRVNSRNKQRMNILADTSGSMAGAKAQQAHAGCQQMIDILADPINKGGFIVGVIFFNEDARIMHSWESAPVLVGNLAPMNPNGSTDIAAAFEKALQMLMEPKKQDGGDKDCNYLRDILFLYSDGNHTEGSDPLPIANKVKELADVVTVAIGADADEKMLMALATSPDHFYRVTDASELRKFLAEAGETITVSLQKGEDATVVATQIRAH